VPDVYAVITEVDPAVVEEVARAMEVSADDPQHRHPVGRQSSGVAASAISSHQACRSSPIVVRTSHVAPASASAANRSAACVGAP
jgi:hypothetical protein